MTTGNAMAMMAPAEAKRMAHPAPVKKSKMLDTAPIKMARQEKTSGVCLRAKSSNCWAETPSLSLSMRFSLPIILP